MGRQTADKRTLFSISIAAERLDLHPQTLRQYERQGLIKPARRGSNRMYSEYDIERIEQIQRLTRDMGVNLAGVEIVLKLLDQLAQLQEDVDALRQQRLPVPYLDENPR